jgi:hypothetical protein
VRTIRRTLDDDPREPRFIRTVSRHGYQFVYPDIIEEEEEGAPVAAAVNAPTPAAHALADGRGVTEAPWTTRWTGAVSGGALAGVAAGVAGGLILAAAPGSTAPIALAPVLAVIAGIAGALGGAGVGVGLAIGETVAGSRRALALTLGGAIGGGLVGVAVQWLTRWGLSGLVGLTIPVGGGLEGVVIGGLAGLGFAMSTRSTPDGPAPRGGRRWQAALIVAAMCGAAGLALTLTGRPLAGGTINAIAQNAKGASASLRPLGRLIGEPDFGPVSNAILSFAETAAFGIGLAFGLLRRQEGQKKPGSLQSHGVLTPP